MSALSLSAPGLPPKAAIYAARSAQQLAIDLIPSFISKKRNPLFGSESPLGPTSLPSRHQLARHQFTEWGPILAWRAAAQRRRVPRLPDAGGGVRQVAVRRDTDESRHILITVARYLAAHSPTERAALQSSAQRFTSTPILTKALIFSL
jgi:hypothetical protein